MAKKKKITPALIGFGLALLVTIGLASAKKQESEYSVSISNIGSEVI